MPAGLSYRHHHSRGTTKMPIAKRAVLPEALLLAAEAKKGDLVDVLQMTDSDFAQFESPSR